MMKVIVLLYKIHLLILIRRMLSDETNFSQILTIYIIIFNLIFYFLCMTLNLLNIYDLFHNFSK